jgi:hypothetical protein
MSAQSSKARANARRRQTYSRRPYRRTRSNGRGNGGYARRSGRARHQSVKHPVMWAVFWTAVIVFMIGNNWLTITGK